MKNNIVGWFEIPVENMERAIFFYNKVLEIKLERHILGNLDMAWFPVAEKGSGAMGSLVYSPGNYKPSTNGVLVYITPPSGDLAIELSRVKEAGGQVIMDKTLISDDIGYMGLFIDSEGNRMAIHSRQEKR